MERIRIKTTEGYETVSCYDISETPRYKTALLRSRKFNRDTKDKELYARNWICLDTETSHRGENDGWIYQWCIGYRTEDYYTIGRTVNDLAEMLYKISSSSGSIVVCYVHNLSYDWEYMVQTLAKYFGDIGKTFWTAPHKLLTARVGNIEFRCSYRMANNSLDGWCKALGSKYIKDTGAIDYTLVRYPDSYLSETDWTYQVSDVASMKDCITIAMSDYNITTVPLTSTGFVRADCRRASTRAKWYHTFQKDYHFTEREYIKLRHCFQGGYTHGNRYHIAETIDNMYCYDYTSSYPARMLYEKFPAEHFHFYGNLDRYTVREKMEKINELAKDRCIIFTLDLYYPEVKPECVFPYISHSKMIDDDYTGVYDNGKLLYADRVTLEVTEIDFFIILKQYKFESLDISDVWTAKKDYLPQWLRGCVRDYFQKKTELDPSDPEYIKSKNRLNGIYGMMVQKISTGEYQEDYKTGEIWNDAPKPLAEEIENYFNNKNSFLYYGHGVYITSFARLALFEMYYAIVKKGHPEDCILYADTDSIFTNEDIADAVEQINDKYIALARQHGGIFKNPKGVYKILGFAELDKTAEKFRYIHSKCYAYETGGKLKVTIAGVTKHWRSDPGKTNGDELGKIDNLNDGFIFRECGGTRSIYNYCDEWKNINGHRVYIGNSVIIQETEYRVTELNALRGDEELYFLLPDDKTSDVFQQMLDM